ncbi:hypothetical protein GCM10010919_03560 [Alishewanella longhuensis]|uniref:Tail specific protease domain-containing protein n=1 Tax=Alishewanella longhuensis TaxID=1091037 RepID=A0ABQ3KYD4_9ALTE|nr:S41 family peptidase [Alishewanella longhuensis]GHG60247.1 hypothetical protein GCM10010919_03560 [Alishewanella longhuensis]
MTGFVIRLLLIASLLFVSEVVTAKASSLNLDFSQTTEQMPTGWYIEGSEQGVINTAHPLKTGQSLRLSRTADTSANYTFAMQGMPFDFVGKTLTLSGWIKTDQVSADGGARLWIRLDGGESMLAINNMQDKLITGSQAWQQVELPIDVSSSVDRIAFGAMLDGTGEAYFADLSLTLDGVPLEKAPRRTFFANELHQFEQDSGIRISQLSTTQQQHLAILAKVWGFVKYYHPESAKGNISMDAELFRLIPKLLSASNTERDQLLVTWISQLGKLTPCTKCKQSNGAALVHPAQFWLSWGLSGELNEQLANIFAAELPTLHYWVKPAPGVGNPIFNEKPYLGISAEDSGFRLLALFRLWNIIHYYSPYRDLAEQPWEQVLLDAIPTVVLAKSELDYQLALAKVVYAIHDTHSQFGAADLSLLRQYIGNNIAPVDVRFVEQQAVVYKVYQEDLPIKVGDIITQIDNKAISERLEYLRPLAAASNEPTRLRNWARWLLRANSEQLTVQVQRDKQAIQLQLPLVALNAIERQRYYHEHGSTAYQRITPDIGYIRLDKIAGVNLDKMMRQFSDTKGLIIDIRNYPSQFVVFSLSEYLYPRPYAFARFTKMHPSNPGQFNWNAPVSVGKVNPRYYNGKIAILINEQTQSQAEYTTMAFRGAPKAKVIGSTTAGADGNVSEILLPGGNSTVLSGIGVFYPDKTPTQRIGIVPDIEVLPTIAGIKAGKDEVLDRAIKYIETN